MESYVIINVCYARVVVALAHSLDTLCRLRWIAISGHVRASYGKLGCSPKYHRVI